MIYGIIADIHANLEALEIVFKFLEEKVSTIFVLGDMIGYGPNPNECLEIVNNKNNCFFIRGNHEEAILKKDFSGFTKEATISLMWTEKILDQSWLEKIETWQEKVDKEGVFFVHGSPSNPLFGYIVSSKHAESEFSKMINPVFFHAHTHFPYCFRKKKGPEKVEILPPDFSGGMEIRIEENYLYLINVGSVGQPRDGLPSACAGFFDSEKKLFKLIRLTYPAEITKDKIFKAGLPSYLGARLLRGT